MGLHHTAHYLKAQGRNKDTELVHMSPKEVKGLQELAKAHGGNLTTNPHTGLPEAGFLEDILPTVVGAGIGVATGNPWLGAAAAGAAPLPMEHCAQSTLGPQPQLGSLQNRDAHVLGGARSMAEVAVGCGSSAASTLPAGGWSRGQGARSSA